MRFPFIKKVTEYARRIFPENMLGFTITTNGTIFTDEMLDFFEKNAFFVLVSLDGPRQYHDRSRKFKNNKGSWDCIMKNLEKIRKKYPGIFKRRLMLSTTIAPPASYKELDDFFSEFGVSQRIGLVEAASLKDCKQFKDLYDYDYVLQKLEDLGVSGQLVTKWYYPGNMFVFNLFKDVIRRLHRRNDRFFSLDKPAKHGLCIPAGFKLFVSAQGALFACEKLEGYPEMKIGHIDRGVDIEAVEGVFSSFRDLGWEECENCWISRFCPCCFLHPLSDGKFSKEKLRVLCEIWRDHYHRMIEVYCSILEKNESAFDYLDNDDLSVMPEVVNT